MITVGQITKPQGVRGEVKVRPLTDDPSRFCVLKTVTIDSRSYKIASARVGGADVYIKLVGVDDRNAAELLRGKYLTIDRAAAKSLDDGEFFIADLVGATLVARGETDVVIGTVDNVQSFGAADVFSVRCKDGGGMSFAFVKALAARYDGNTNTLSVDKSALDGVAVYDDD